MTPEQYGKQPAFPHATVSEHITYPGMTVRDVFAGLALQGLLANSYYAREAAEGQHSGTIEGAALYHADALVALLAKDGA